MTTADREARLQQIYLAALEGRLNEIQRGYEAVISGNEQAHALFTLYRLAHNFAGSSATYGYETIADQARSMELWLEVFVEKNTLPSSHDETVFKQLLDDLKQVCKQCQN